MKCLERSGLVLPIGVVVQAGLVLPKNIFAVLFSECYWVSFLYFFFVIIIFKHRCGSGLRGSSFSGSCLDVDVLSQHTRAVQKHDEFLPTKNASNFLQSCALHLACTSVSFWCGFRATYEDRILNSNLIQISVHGEPLLLKCRLSQYSVGAERCVPIHTHP